MNLVINTMEIAFIHCHCATSWKWENTPRTQLTRSMLVTKIAGSTVRQELHCTHHEILTEIVTIVCKCGFYTSGPDAVFQTADAASVTLSLFYSKAFRIGSTHPQVTVSCSTFEAYFLYWMI